MIRGRVFITGDKHADLQIGDLMPGAWPEGQKLSRDDLLIIAGDFGGIFYGDKRDNEVLDFYSNQPWTTSFVDGNHECFDLLDKYPVSEWNGGKVHFIRDSIIHLMRGQVFTIEGKAFFTMGGATSTDKNSRVEGKSWWPQELPSWEEYVEADKNLEKHNNKVDFMITHACSARTFYWYDAVNFSSFKRDPLTDYFDELEKRVSFGHWYFGHHHEDVRINESHTMLCHKVIQII